MSNCWKILLLNVTLIKHNLFFKDNLFEQIVINLIKEAWSDETCQGNGVTSNNNLQKAEALRQSILKQAFEGKLTEQWRKEHKDLISGENSAEALLKKIKKEKNI